VLDNPFYLDNRLADVAFLLRCLRGENVLDERVVARVDQGRLGMAGHSYGAYTTLVIAGARLERDCPGAGDPALAGFKAALAISGQGAGRLFFADRSFASIRLPLFAITGTKDTGAGDETPAWRQQPFRDSPAGNKVSAVVDGFGHRDFDPPADDAERAAKGEALRQMQLEFWDAFLRNRSECRKALLSRAAGPTRRRRDRCRSALRHRSCFTTLERCENIKRTSFPEPVTESVRHGPRIPPHHQDAPAVLEAGLARLRPGHEARGLSILPAVFA
jgi:pimeloyl-ACP methyl ester carboxylesterase